MLGGTFGRSLDKLTTLVLAGRFQSCCESEGIDYIDYDCHYCHCHWTDIKMILTCYYCFRMFPVFFSPALAILRFFLQRPNVGRWTLAPSYCSSGCVAQNEGRTRLEPGDYLSPWRAKLRFF